MYLLFRSHVFEIDEAERNAINFMRRLSTCKSRDGHTSDILLVTMQGLAILYVQTIQVTRTIRNPRSQSWPAKVTLGGAIFYFVMRDLQEASCLFHWAFEALAR